MLVDVLDQSVRRQEFIFIRHIFLDHTFRA
jgi:hypothetical protein